MKLFPFLCLLFVTCMASSAPSAATGKFWITFSTKWDTMGMIGEYFTCVYRSVRTRLPWVESIRLYADMRMEIEDEHLFPSPALIIKSSMTIPERRAELLTRCIRRHGDLECGRFAVSLEHPIFSMHPTPYTHMHNVLDPETHENWISYRTRFQPDLFRIETDLHMLAELGHLNRYSTNPHQIINLAWNVTRPRPGIPMRVTVTTPNIAIDCSEVFVTPKYGYRSLIVPAARNIYIPNQWVLEVYTEVVYKGNVYRPVFDAFEELFNPEGGYPEHDLPARRIYGTVSPKSKGKRRAKRRKV